MPHLARMGALHAIQWFGVSLIRRQIHRFRRMADTTFLPLLDLVLVAFGSLIMEALKLLVIFLPLCSPMPPWASPS